MSITKNITETAKLLGRFLNYGTGRRLVKSHGYDDYFIVCDAGESIKEAVRRVAENSTDEPSFIAYSVDGELNILKVLPVALDVVPPHAEVFEARDINGKVIAREEFIDLMQSMRNEMDKMFSKDKNDKA